MCDRCIAPLLTSPPKPSPKDQLPNLAVTINRTVTHEACQSTRRKCCTHIAVCCSLEVCFLALICKHFRMHSVAGRWKKLKQN